MSAWPTKYGSHASPSSSGTVVNAGACTLWLRGYLARVFSCENEAGESLVMKLSPPIALPEVEAAALRHWDGDGAARLRDFDREAGALLLDRIVPGAPLPPNDEALAITAAASVLRRLHAKPPPLDGVIPLMPEALVWWEGLARSEAEPLAVGTSLLPQAMAAARALAASTSAPLAIAST